jgi:hypothetical protein
MNLDQGLGLTNSYEVFSSFRDALVATIAGAKSRVYLTTLAFTDGDLATALLSARLRGVETKALIDPSRTRSYTSRHAYFAENQIQVLMRPLNRTSLGGGSVLLIDDKTAAVDAALDSRTKGRVTLVPGPAWEEVEGWFQKLPVRPWKKPCEPSKMITTKPTPAPAPSAKIPTTPTPPAGQPATIKTSRRETPRVPTRKGLPVKTRVRQIEEGAISPESLGQQQGKGTGSLSPVPGDSRREESLSGLN